MTERNARPVDGDPEERIPAEEEGGREPGDGAPGEAGGAAPPVDLEAEVHRYKAEAEQHWQQFLHAAADLENYKKQAIRARDDAVERTRRALFAVILTVVDNVERALDYGDQNDTAGAIRAGIRMTHRQTLDLLASMGVRPLSAVGQPFDPRFHEAVEVVPADRDHAPGTVVAEIQRGYLIGDEVLRPARVRVAQPGDPAAE